MSKTYSTFDEGPDLVWRTRSAALTRGAVFVATGVASALVSPLDATAQMSAAPAAITGYAALAAHDTTDRIDPVAELHARLASGEAELPRDPMFGYLPAVLEALDIPLSSQSLVFSRTSLQVDVIAPWAPRAIYFNDDVYVGYTVDGLVLELASVDPDGGTVFYTVDQFDQDGALPRRDDRTCKGCHSTGMTSGVSGVLVRSFLTDRMGNTILPIEERPVDDRTPMSRRFGGWYVTGSHSLPHAGNTRAPELVHEIDQPFRYLDDFDVAAGGNVQSLEGRFDPSFYMTEGSDIVAIMVLAHQTRIHNLITVAAEAADEALEEQRYRALSAGGDTGSEDLTEATASRIDFAVRALVRAMLFYRAEPIGQVEGTGNFVADFEARGPRDAQGRSLRDFSLDDRLFEYPLSFLVYSDAWDALAPIVKERAWAYLYEVLTGDDDPDFPLLDAERRGQILSILEATKPDFATFLAERVH